jgi:hypothetical protein
MNLPPIPPAITISQPIATSNTWQMPVSTNDPHVVYYQVTISNSNNHSVVVGVTPQLYAMEHHYTGMDYSLSRGTNFITWERCYANGVHMCVDELQVITYSVSSVTNNMSTNIQYSFDLTNWTDLNTNLIFLRNKL